MYKKVDLFGKRNGRGTFDTFYDNEKYKTLEEADNADDVVVIDFVRDESGRLSFEAYKTTDPENKLHQMLQIQRPVAGIDVMDDRAACLMAEKLLSPEVKGVS